MHMLAYRGMDAPESNCNLIELCLQSSGMHIEAGQSSKRDVGLA